MRMSTAERGVFLQEVDMRVSSAVAVFLAIVSGTAFAQSAATQQMEQASMALPALTLGFAPTYVADAQGFWTKRDLRVTLRDIVGTGAMDALLAGSVDFSNSSGPTVIRAAIRGQKVLGIGSTLDGLPFEIIVRKDLAQAAGVTDKTPVDKRAQLLMSRKISLTSVDAIPHALLRYFLRKGGFDPSRYVVIVSQAPEAGIAALKAREVDAFVQGTPWPMIAGREADSMVLLSPVRGDLPELIPFAFNIVVTRPQVCEKRPSVCRKLMDGYVDGMVFMREHPEESLAVLARKMPQIDPGILKEAYDLTVRWTPSSGKISPSGLAHSQDLMVTGGMIKTSEKLASFDSIFTNQFTK
jgi:NitT/TauT family transport system substrate-binding protein